MNPHLDISNSSISLRDWVTLVAGVLFPSAPASCVLVVHSCALCSRSAVPLSGAHWSRRSVERGSWPPLLEGDKFGGRTLTVVWVRLDTSSVAAGPFGSGLGAGVVPKQDRGTPTPLRDPAVVNVGW